MITNTNTALQQDYKYQYNIWRKAAADYFQLAILLHAMSDSILDNVFIINHLDLDLRHHLDHDLYYHLHRVKFPMWVYFGA